MTRVFSFLSLLSLFFFPGIALAGYTPTTLDIRIGSGLTIPQILGRIITYLGLAIGVVCMALILIGAFFVVIGGAKEDARGKGKDMIVGALIGLIVVGIAYAILRTVTYFLYVA